MIRWQLVATAWLASAPAVAAVPIAGTTVVLAAGGEPQATIVIPKGSDALLCNGVLQAAQELSQFIAEMANSAPLPIVVDDEQGGSSLSNLAGGVVFVGAVPWALEIAGFDATALEQEGIAVFAHNSSWLFVLGRSDGRDGDRHECGSDWSGRNDTLHSAYTLLESLGVHWLGPYSGGSFVPRRDSVVAPAGGVPLKQAPVLMKRQIRKVYQSAEYYSPNVPWLNQSVFDGLKAKETLWLQRMRLGQHDTPPWGQAFSTWWERYGTTHPEYFALNPNGKRGPLSASKPDRVKMCVSNPALWQAVASGGTNHNPFGAAYTHLLLPYSFQHTNASNPCIPQGCRLLKMTATGASVSATSAKRGTQLRATTAPPANTPIGMRGSGRIFGSCWRKQALVAAPTG